MIKRILFIAVAMLSAVSCLDFDDYLFVDNNIGDVQSDGSIACDSGVTYQIEKQENNTAYRSYTRIYASFKAKELVTKDPLVYKAELLEFIPVKYYKKALVASQIKDKKILGEDDIAVNEAWYSYGNLNLRTSIYIAASDTLHSINLVYDDLRSNSDTLFVDLSHNCNGDEGTTIYTFYSTFPLGDYFPSDRNKVILRIGWKADGEEDETIGTIYKGNNQ